MKKPMIAKAGVALLNGTANLNFFACPPTNDDVAESIVGTPLDTGGFSQFTILGSQRTLGVRLGLVC